MIYKYGKVCVGRGGAQANLAEVMPASGFDGAVRLKRLDDVIDDARLPVPLRVFA